MVEPGAIFEILYAESKDGEMPMRFANRVCVSFSTISIADLSQGKYSASFTFHLSPFVKPTLVWCPFSRSIPLLYSAFL